MDWWALPNASSIVWIRSAVHEILADKAFTATDGLISQSFVVAFVHPTYVQIVLIWGFPAQLGLWKLVHWLWRYKLNEVYDRSLSVGFLWSGIFSFLEIFWNFFYLLQWFCWNWRGHRWDIGQFDCILIVTKKRGSPRLRVELHFDFASKCSVVFHKKSILLRFVDHIDEFP